MKKVYIAWYILISLVEHVWVLGPLVGVDLAEVVDHGEPEALPNRVVVRQPVIPAPHDVERRQVQRNLMRQHEQPLRQLQQQHNISLKCLPR